ncbi:MAG: carboxypeptidase regulatory-like domain-containing protein [Acidobacteria bacterium]|nr:carboxypeptidase regulatory-like domain-containing protein [Acidobacteriota bacterium]
MKRTATHSRLLPLFTALLTLALLAVSAAAQTPEAAEPQTTTTRTNAVESAQQEVARAQSVVRGRAVYDDTGRPIRRARVLLLEIESRGSERSGNTNNSGEFEIKDVPAGSYFVMVDIAGVITPLSFVDLEEAASNKINFEEIKKQFDEVVVDGTHDVTVKVRARRGGAISGKVTYADGDAAINVRINVMRKTDGRAVRFLTNFNPSSFFGLQTDDRGYYRVAGLPPGEYIVSASEPVDHGGDGRSQRGGDYMGAFGLSSLIVTYYPGSSKESGATAIQVDAGQEQNEINISLLERSLHIVSGTVVARRDRQPLRGATVALKSRDDRSTDAIFSSGNSVQTDEQGRFNFIEIPDGAYTLSVQPPYQGDVTTAETAGSEQPAPEPTPAPVSPQRKLTNKQQDITVTDSDLNDITITLSDGASVSGTVAAEGSQSLPSDITVTLFPFNGARDSLEDAQQNLVSGNVKANGTFSLDGVPEGAFYPYVTIQSGSQYYVKAITAGGTDLLRDPLSVGDGATINNVRVVVSPDAATLSGRVQTGAGEPQAHAAVMLIPTDRTRWRARTSFLSADSESNGSYSVSGAPGEYLVFVLNQTRQSQPLNEAWIGEHAANAQRVMLLPKERKTLNLTAPAQ